MTDWTSGYVADIGYTFGYYNELNPLRARFALIDAGISFPTFGTACELGFGQGMSVNLHAAASPTQWCGNDFNPAHAAFAQELADAAGAGARMFDDTFGAFAEREDLPDFDFIGLHGIWSWVSDANRTILVDFIARKLKVGGVVYISYNTLPGWAPLDLMALHAETMGAPGEGIVNRVGGAMAFVEKVMAANPMYVAANPVVASRFSKLKTQNSHYLAHEYFNRDWLPMHFSTMAEWLTPAKLSYACSANFLEHVDNINLRPEQQALLQEILDPVFRESVRDMMVNQVFRADLWVKGARKLNPSQKQQFLREQRVLLTKVRDSVPLKIKAILGEADLTERVYKPVLDVLADHKPRSLAEIEQLVNGQAITFPEIAQAIMVLIGAGHVMLAQDEAAAAQAKPHADRLNRFICERARHVGEIANLASPLTGGGVSVGRFEQLFLLGVQLELKTTGDLAAFVWAIVNAQGETLIKEGKRLETAEQNLAEFTGFATFFLEKQLPIYRALQLV